MANTSSVRRGPVRILAFFQEAREELKKVAWPDRRTTARYTIVVIIVSLGTSVVIGSLDWLLQLFLEQSL